MDINSAISGLIISLRIRRGWASCTGRLGQHMPCGHKYILRCLGRLVKSVDLASGWQRACLDVIVSLLFVCCHRKDNRCSLSYQIRSLPWSRQCKEPSSAVFAALRWTAQEFRSKEDGCMQESAELLRCHKGGVDQGRHIMREDTSPLGKLRALEGRNGAIGMPQRASWAPTLQR